MKYYIIAGEASGDLHGSNLMKGLYSQDSGAQIRFWGGDLMAAVWKASEKPQENPAGDSSGEFGGLVRDYREGAVMGFWEVFKKASKLLGNVRDCKRDILAHRPDVVILIDYPGFNFKIAKFAHKHGIKTFYYIAPKVWASREGRIRKLKKYVDKLFIVFPFEKEYFRSKGIDFIYRGNPLVDAVDGSAAMSESREDFLNRNALEDKPWIAMLAGSRKNEISSMMPVLTGFADKMHALPRYSDYQFIVAGAPGRKISDYSPFIGGRSYIKVLFGETQSVIRHAEAAVVNSGTASLETVLFRVPQVVGYIMSPITYEIGKLIIKVKFISLGNLIINRLAFRELIQDECNADALVAEVRRLTEDGEYRSKMLADYDEIRSLLGGSGASEAVAAEITKILRSE